MLSSLPLLLPSPPPLLPGLLTRARSGSYFDRDVECVRRFFRKRFRFFSSEYPRFRDVVPLDRALQRAKRQRRKEAKERGETVLLEEGEEEEEQEEGVLELDVLTNASGLGGGKKGELELVSELEREGSCCSS